MSRADHQEWREDPHAKLVIGQGDGRAFSAGGDIKGMSTASRSNAQLS